MAVDLRFHRTFSHGHKLRSPDFTTRCPLVRAVLLNGIQGIPNHMSNSVQYSCHRIYSTSTVTDPYYDFGWRLR